MHVLSIGADRSTHGLLHKGSAGSDRQRAYAEALGSMDIIGFSRRSDKAVEFEDGALHVYPTNSMSRWFYAKDALRIARRLHKPDIVTAQDPFEAGLTAFWISRHFGVPLHIQIHTDFLSAEYRTGSLLNRIRIMIARYVLRRADRIRVVSEKIKERIIAKYHPTASITVLPMYVDLGRFATTVALPELAKRFHAYSYRFLVVSRLEQEKNVALAIHAFATHAPKDSCLIVLGEGSELALLKACATQLGVSARVYFEGYRDPAPYYALADLVLVTSRYEGYGLVIVEALAAGKPVLSTDVGVVSEAGAIVVAPDSFGAALDAWVQGGARAGVLATEMDMPFEKHVVQLLC